MPVGVDVENFRGSLDEMSIFVEDVDLVSEEVVFPCKGWGKPNSHFSAEVKRGSIVWLNVKFGGRDTLVYDDIVGFCLSL